MKLKKTVVSILLLALLACVFLCFGTAAMAEDVAQDVTTQSYEAETAEATVQSSLGIWLVMGCTVLLAAAGVVSVNCQKIYDSEK